MTLVFSESVLSYQNEPAVIIRLWRAGIWCDRRIGPDCLDHDFSIVWTAMVDPPVMRTHFQHSWHTNLDVTPPTRHPIIDDLPEEAVLAPGRDVCNPCWKRIIEGNTE